MSELINRHITTLLRRHDCVIMPGIGAFVANQQPAGFDIKSGLFTPPVRVISFNPAITHDDGLLASSLSRRMKISFEQARERLEEETALMQRRLKAEGAVKISRVGILMRHSDSRLDFRPEGSWKLSLPTVSCPRTMERPLIEVVSPVTGNKSVAIVRVPLHLRRLRAAAAAMVIFLIGFALSTPIDLEQAQNASLAAPTFTVPEAPRFETPVAPAGLELNIASAPVGASLPALKPIEEKPMKYLVVVASFNNLSQANTYIEQTKFPGLQIHQSGDNFRIYAAAGATQADAMSAAMALDGFRSAFTDVWVCRR